MPTSLASGAFSFIFRSQLPRIGRASERKSKARNKVRSPMLQLFIFAESTAHAHYSVEYLRFLNYNYQRRRLSRTRRSRNRCPLQRIMQLQLHICTFCPLPPSNFGTRYRRYWRWFYTGLGLRSPRKISTTECLLDCEGGTLWLALRLRKGFQYSQESRQPVPMWHQ